ncbi:MAG: hypothetical protein KGI98_17580 [Euryarchaeota archaeon]|nr:hypothetical protein [Euryarchaeota archaeon]
MVTLPTDVHTEAIRVADRNTYESLLAAKAALSAFTYAPNPDAARKAITALDAHVRAVMREREVLQGQIDAVTRAREGVEDFIVRTGQVVERPGLPGSPLAFAPAQERFRTGPAERCPGCGHYVHLHTPACPCGHVLGGTATERVAYPY